MFSSILPVAGNDEGRHGKSQQIKYLALSLVSLVRFWVLRSWISLHDTWPAGNRRGIPVSKGEKNLCTGVSRVK